MKDIKTHLDKIRSDAAECLLLSSLVPDGKREVFAKTAQHLNALAFEVEKAVAASKANTGASGESENAAGEAEIATNVAAAPHQKAAGRRALLWTLFVVAAGIIGAIVWKIDLTEDLSSFTLQRETSLATRDEAKQDIAAILSNERADRKVMMDQLTGLGARVDNLARALEHLETSRAESFGKWNEKSVGAEENPPSAETSLSAHEEGPVRRAESGTSVSESPAAAKRPDGALTPTDSGSGDQVGAIPAPSRRVELGERKATIGPAGCTQFRSFDPVSGTYTTLDGRRRPCR
jgi:BA14K-like protein